MLVWRLRERRRADKEQIETLDRRAHARRPPALRPRCVRRFRSYQGSTHGEHPRRQTSWAIFLSGLSIGVMMWLPRAKRRAAVALGSRALQANRMKTAPFNCPRSGDGCDPHVWAAWCEDCEKDLPVLEGVASRLKQSGVEVVGVSIDSTRERPAHWSKDGPGTCCCSASPVAGSPISTSGWCPLVRLALCASRKARSNAA